MKKGPQPGTSRGHVSEPWMKRLWYEKINGNSKVVPAKETESESHQQPQGLEDKNWAFKVLEFLTQPNYQCSMKVE